MATIKKETKDERYKSVGSTDAHSVEDAFHIEKNITQFEKKSKFKNSFTLIDFELKKIIIGDDERSISPISTFPYKSICLLEILDKNNESYQGTGFFISPRCVVTAGHCVFFNGKWAKEIAVLSTIKNKNGSFEKTSSNNFKSVKGWVSDGDINFDYGAVILNDSALYSSIGAGLKLNNDINENSIVISGYPKDKNKTQWMSNGVVQKRSKYRLYYELDTLEGNSGSPILSNSGINSNVIGIHTQGDNPNYGIRLNQQIIDRIQEWTLL